MLLQPRLFPRAVPLPALLPPLAGVAAGYALHRFVGGGSRVWAMADAAGPYSALMVGAVVGLTCLLSLLLLRAPTAPPAPLVVMVGLALVPWLLGIAGTQDAMQKVLAALPSEGGGGAALAALVSGTGEAMVTRLLGAWMSAALLGAVAVGLVLQHWRTARETRESGRLLGAGLGLAMAGLALLVAIEAHDLFELLTPLATQAPQLHAGHITTISAHLGNLYQLRSACLGALAVLALALVGWQFFLRPEAVSQWAGSLLLVGVAATALFLDTQPLRLDVSGRLLGDASQARPTRQVRELLTSTLDAVARAALQAPGRPPLP